MKTLVILPSYNERENILELIAALRDTVPDAEVCVVDDSSPDGTAALVDQAIQARPGWKEHVHLLLQATKGGRGGAVRKGLAWGLERGHGFEAFVEMDCDFSHQPGAVRQGLDLLRRGHDVVIGARYPDGTILGWPRRRHVFSFLANQLARVLIDRGICDYTNGFRFYSPRAVRLLIQHPQKYKGYIYLSETMSHLLRAGMSVTSFPIVFKNRERGTSNTDFREIRGALKGILHIAWEHRFGAR